MPRGKLLALVLVAAATTACGGEHDAGTSGTSTGGSESSTEASSTTSVTTTTEMTSSTTGMVDSSGGSTEASSSESGTIPDACMPQPEDTACAMCTREMCCDPLVVCFGNPDCECFANCYAMMGFMSDEMCRMQCTLDANPDGWTDVYNCSAMNCLSDCI